MTRSPLTERARMHREVQVMDLSHAVHWTRL